MQLGHNLLLHGRQHRFTLGIWQTQNFMAVFPSTLQRLLLGFDCHHPEFALELDGLAVV